MSVTTFHVSIDVRGYLEGPADRRLLLAQSLTVAGQPAPVRAEEIDQVLRDLLDQGQERLAIGEACEGFDPKTGCPGHAAERRLPPRQIEIMQHALGYGRRQAPGWRNYFATTRETVDYLDIQALVKDGLMVLGAVEEGGMRYFHVTEEGKRVARRAHEAARDRVQRAALQMRCGQCGALSGDQCRTRRGVRRTAHHRRVRAGGELA